MAQPNAIEFRFNVPEDISYEMIDLLFGGPISLELKQGVADRGRWEDDGGACPE